MAFLPVIGGETLQETPVPSTILPRVIYGPGRLTPNQRALHSLSRGVVLGDEKQAQATQYAAHTHQ